MRVDLKKRYAILVKYLSELLGPSYEITLHDLSKKDGSIIAIANGHITGRTLGDHFLPTVKKFIEEKQYLYDDYEVNFLEHSTGDHTLRTSTLYIMDNMELVGLLCITFDDILYKNLGRELMRLCHPDYLLQNQVQTTKEIYHEDPLTEFIHIENNMEKHFNYIRKKYKIGKQKLSKEQKLQIVRDLKNNGIFDIKGSLEATCQLIEVSISTIYRYLKEVERRWK